MKKLYVSSTVVIGLFAVAIVAFIFWSVSPASTTSPDEIPLLTLDRSETTLLNFEQKPTVISIFTSWCPYCNEDAPKMVELHAKYKDDISLIGVNIIGRDEMSEVTSYIERHKINYPILLDDTGELYRHYGEAGFPSLYFVNQQGQVIDSIIGSTDINSIEASFKKLLATAS